MTTTQETKILCDDMKKLHQSIEEQLDNLEKDTNITSKSNFMIAQNWESINSILGLSAVIISGIVTILGAMTALKGMEDVQHIFNFASTILASIITVVGSILTFLKPSERAGRYREFGNKQKALRNRIRIYRNVILAQEKYTSIAIEKLEEFNKDKDTLNSDNPPISLSVYLKIKKEIKPSE